MFAPADVFYFANYIADQAGADRPPYGVEIVAARPGPVRTASGPRILAERAIDDPALRPDVVLVAGGLQVEETAADPGFVRDARSLGERSGEVGSICTGAVLLAEAGILDGRRATTHWALAGDFARSHPQIAVEADRIFVEDGVWTSAGVTAGIDLALEIVRTHHGADMAADAARNMVVYLQRADGQQQFSTHLTAQRSSNTTIADLVALIADHPEADLSVAALARHVSMSERSFHRPFTTEVGISPGKYVERARIDAARERLEHSPDGLASAARRCGFGSLETFLRSFKRVVGVNPTEYRMRFARASGDRRSR